MIKFLKGLPAAVIRGVGAFFSSQWKQFTPLGQALFLLGVAAIMVDAGISYEYGVSQTRMHGFGFGILAIALAVLPDVVVTEFRKHKYGSAVCIGLGCAVLAPVAYQSHIGYGAGVRSGDMQDAAISKIKFDDIRTSLESERASLKMWREQLATLQAENAAHRAKNHGWQVTIDPVAMQAQVDEIDTKIKNEAARVKCAAKCEQLKTQKSALLAAIAGITRENELATRIEATQRVVDEKTKTAAASTMRNSTVVNQNDTFVKLYKVFTGSTADDAIKVDEGTRQFVSIFTAGSGALAFMLLAPLLMVAAGLNRKPEFLGRKEDHEAPTSHTTTLITNPVEPQKFRLASMRELASIAA